MVVVGDTTERNLMAGVSLAIIEETIEAAHQTVAAMDFRRLIICQQMVVV